jgi:toxin-antitoxin system, antitoxin component, xre family
METFLKIAKILDVELDELLNKSHLTSLDNE